MSATVIIPTTGAPELRNAIQSVLDQSYPRSEEHTSELQSH